jgi:hypothetical protein
MATARWVRIELITAVCWRMKRSRVRWSIRQLCCSGVLIETNRMFVRKVVVSRQLKRRYVLAFFQKLPSCLVGIEACASSHYWSRELQALGHRVLRTAI